MTSFRARRKVLPYGVCTLNDVNVKLHPQVMKVMKNPTVDFSLRCCPSPNLEISLTSQKTSMMGLSDGEDVDVILAGFV